MSWNIGDKRNLFFRPKSKLGLHDVRITTPKTSIKQFTLTVVARQQMPDLKKTGPSKKYLA